MNFQQYQVRAWATAIYPNKGNNLYYPALGLGEAGEVQGKIKKVMRDHEGEVTPEMRSHLVKELGDVLWYVAALCTELGVSMQEVASINLKKLASRKEKDTLQGSGDNR